MWCGEYHKWIVIFFIFELKREKSWENADVCIYVSFCMCLFVKVREQKSNIQNGNTISSHEYIFPSFFRYTTHILNGGNTYIMRTFAENNFELFLLLCGIITHICTPSNVCYYDKRGWKLYIFPHYKICFS